MTALLCALLLRVEVLALLHPREAFIEAPGGVVHAIAEGNEVRLRGAREASAVARLRFEATGTLLAVRVQGLPGPRSFPGALEATARDGVLHFVNEVPLEEYVASVVEAELGGGAPGAAQEALAVVARSFAVSRAQQRATPAGSRGHQAGAPLCDQTHCQVYKGAARLAAARAAARRTADEVLVLGSGAVAPALHHAACGGRTRGAREVWPGASPDDEEAGVAVDDTLGAPARRAGGPAFGPACRQRPGEPALDWAAVLSEQSMARALGAPLPLSLAVEAGPEGRLRRLHVGGVGIFSAEEVHLRLGRALGWSAVRSPLFSLVWTAAAPHRAVHLSGQGHGHGVGLCQRGASERASRGADRHQLLARFFPKLRVQPLPRGPKPQ